MDWYQGLSYLIIISHVALFILWPPLLYTQYTILNTVKAILKPGISIKQRINSITTKRGKHKFTTYLP